MSEPEPLARYIDPVTRVEHTVKYIRCGRHKGAVPLVTILENGVEKTMSLRQWRDRRFGMILS